MKKYFLMLTVLTLGIVFSACGKEKPENTENPEISNNLQETGEDGLEDIKNWSEPDSGELSKAVLYYENEAVDLLCYGEDGIIYTYNRQGKKLCAYDKEGKFVKEYPMEGEGILSLCCHDQKFYYIDGEYLYSMDLTSKEPKLLYTFDGDTFAFGRMVGIKDTLFILRKQQYNDEWAKVDSDEGYTYEGEELLCYQLSTNEMSKPNIPNIKQIAKKGENELLVYAYDEEKGYYFTSCDENGVIGKKQNVGAKIGQILDIAYDNISDRVVIADTEGIALAKLNNLSNKTYVFQGTSYGYNSLICEDGFTYELFDVDGKEMIVCVENSAFIKEFPELKAYTLASTFKPPYYGYKVDWVETSFDEMAMILLAGDSDYDFIILQSWDNFSENMRRVGAYSALNSLNGIDEFLEDCYPYVKEAATAENDDIWMLPLGLECPVLLYNENLIKEWGMDQIDTYTEFIDKVVALPKDGTIFYNAPYYLMTMDITNKYMADYAIEENHSNFHTDLFRTYLDLMSQYDLRVNAGENIFAVKDHDETYPINLDKRFSKTLFSLVRSSEVKEDEFFHFDEYDYFHAAPAFGLEEGKKQKAQTNAYFIVVNPNSKKQKWVFSYLEKVIKGIREDKNSLMLRTNDFSDRPLWQEVQEILTDAEVYFEYPQEIISDELRHYRLEGQSYEDTVKEMERKMDMYLNE